MASKQLGKLRQWAGEVISTKDKTTVTEEFRQREKEIELRKDGLQRLHMASESYLQALSKKKESDALDEAEKLMPIDTLGIVMIVHGEELSGTAASHFSDSLVKLGRAHCRIATLQEAYALTFKDTFITSLDKFMDDIREYEVLRKKLESRRLTLDSAITKADKAKKDKDKQEAEEELAKAQVRYDETEDDVHGYMKVVEDNEIDQQRELGALLDAQLNFAQQYLNVLKDVKAEWRDGSIISKTRSTEASPAHVFSRPSKQPPKYSSVRSRQSVISNGDSNASSDEDGDTEGATSRPQSRRPSSASRPTTPSRKRRDSATTNATTVKSPSIPSLSRPSSRNSRRKSVGEIDEKVGSSRRLNVSNWMGSISGKNKKKLESDEENEEVVEKDDDSSKHVRSPSASRRSTILKMIPGNKSKESPAKMHRTQSSLSQPKLVRALHSFSSEKSDELSFQAGDQIVIINEVTEGWWMGELNGSKGLFPSSYTEPWGASKPKPPPRLPSRPGVVASPITNDADSDDFGGHFPDNHHFHDDSSITDEEVEEQESRGLFSNDRHSPSDSFKAIRPGLASRGSFSSSSSSNRNILTNASPFTAVRRLTTEPGSESPASSTGGKRAPPPPPPRRATTPSNNSTNSSLLLPQPTSLYQGASYDTSPFDSTTDLGAESEDPVTGCGNFKQNPFKPKGMCNNCFEYHSEGL